MDKIKFSSGNNSHFGLKPIIVDYNEITIDNVIDIIDEILPTFTENRKQIQELKAIFTGQQAILSRENDTTNTNERVNINLLPNIIYTMAGLYLGEKIDYVYSGVDENEEIKREKRKDVTTLNKQMRKNCDILCDKSTLVEMLVSGVGYQYCGGDVKNTIKLANIESEDCFSIRSSSVGHDIIATGMYFNNNDIEKISIFTDKYKIILKKDNKNNSDWSIDFDSSTPHSHPKNPLQEIKLNDYRYSLVANLEAAQNAFNVTVSDSINSTIENIRAALAITGAEITKEDYENIRETNIIQVVGQDGRNISLGYLTKQLDENIINLRQFLKDIMLFIAGMPLTGGGTSGNSGAVMFANGFFIVNQNAYFNELEFKPAKINQIENVISALKREKLISSDLTIDDIEIRFDRNKLSNINEVANAISTLNATGIPMNHILKTTGAFNNIDEIIEDMNKQTLDIIENAVTTKTKNGDI